MRFANKHLVASSIIVLCWLSFANSSSLLGQIRKPADAPKPSEPEHSQSGFRAPDGFQMKLVASEPLIREPSGICWDERGQMFVCELHGYNLEGQYDIEELNKAGQLDHAVQRIQADERFKKAAEAETYGTIKLLKDMNGDGQMDRVSDWADRIPPCLGICPARGGLIAACKTKILYLADRDGDDRAEIQEVLFDGFEGAKPGPLERSISNPQLGPDNWIYFGRGASGGKITGKYLAAPVVLPNTDFRIKADGTAIEPVVGNTGTIGFTFTESCDRFVISTNTPGNFVAPIAWRYLARNPNVAAPALQYNASSDQRVYPTSQPHPWRVKRANDPGFAKLYTDRYGVAESAPNGYFTSACSPLAYQDIALPGLNGQLFACEPAQNFVHRAIMKRDGARLTLHRDPSELQSEFLSNKDPWFHAISLAHAPDGSIAIIDFYREIIEDYSAIPRYLQQQYGLIDGQDYGRVWRLTHANAVPTPSADMSQLSPQQLAREIQSPHYWRRTTARRLIVERGLTELAPELSGQLSANNASTFGMINSLSTLEGLRSLNASHVLIGLNHPSPAVRRFALQLSEPFLGDDAVRSKVLTLGSDQEAMVRLQVALSLGEVADEVVGAVALPTLAGMARHHAHEPWMTAAILSSLPNHGGQLLAELLNHPNEIGHASELLQPLCTAIANRQDASELSAAFECIANCSQQQLLLPCLQGLQAGIKAPLRIDLDEQAMSKLSGFATSRNADIRKAAAALTRMIRKESAADRQARIERLRSILHDVQASSESQLAAVTELSAENDASVTQWLVSAVPNTTPQVRDALLVAVFERNERLEKLLDAIEANQVSAAWLSGVQRATMLEAKNASVRERANRLLSKSRGPNSDILAQYTAALKEPRDATQGRETFQKRCAVCHQAHGIGAATGPNLSSEFQRAEETIIRDVLAPSETITAGYVTHVLSTVTGHALSGIVISETPTSITLAQADGKQELVLRKDIDELKAIPVSIMPEDLYKQVSPQELANLLAWIRQPPKQVSLIDENRSIIDVLNQGNGQAELITQDKHSGQYALRITPLQRHSPRIPGWNFAIREHPRAGEYRFIRFAWKSEGKQGVMIELAANGRWPDASQPERRYHAGPNSTGWQSNEVSSSVPTEWTTVTRDLWKDFGEFTLTGIAPTAMGAPALFDSVELLQEDPSLANSR